MKLLLKYLTIAVLVFYSHQALAQDKLILINQDTINIKLLKNTSERLTFSYWGEDLENEISTLLVNTVVMGSGRVINYKLSPIRPFADKVGSGDMLTKMYTDTLFREAKLFFENHLVSIHELEIPSEYADTELGEFIRAIDNPFKKLDRDIEVRGYAFGAYLTLLKRVRRNYTDYLHCYFFYSAIPKERIRSVISGHEFNLEESILVYTGLTKKDEKTKYSIRFNENSTFQLKVGDTIIGDGASKWNLLDKNVIQFSSDTTGKSPELWTIVYLGNDSFRMTSSRGEQSSNMVSRLLQRVN